MPNQKNVETPAIEHNGVSFETLVPERVWLIPELDAETRVKFGIRMTNKTQKPLRFSSYRTFFPGLIEPSGKNLRAENGANVSRPMLECDCPLVEPGESVTFFGDGELTWRNNNKLHFKGRRECGAVWHFLNDIKPGRYSLYFRYNNPQEKRRMYDLERKKTRISESMWTGQVETPLIEISVVLPHN
jgi:hypothetical protein